MARKGGKRDDQVVTSDIQCYFLQNISFHRSPESPKPYVAISILDPIITIERHHGKYHAAARFNVEATILGYENAQRDGHECFFQDICLQYLSSWDDEDLFTRPESDPSSAMTVTRGTETNFSGTAEMSFSQTPSANVSLGLDRTKSLTVEYALSTWSVSAHRIAPAVSSASTLTRKDAVPSAIDAKTNPVYQWFWAGTHRDTKTLTPDLRFCVKRHVVLKRAIPVNAFPKRPTKEKAKDQDQDQSKSDEENASKKSTEEEEGKPAVKPTEVIPDNDQAQDVKDQQRTLDSLLDFTFHIQVRVKKRFGRFHRAMLLSGNDVKGKLLKPTFAQSFRLRADPQWDGVPESDTPDINALLGKLKQDYTGNWDDLADKDFFELSDAYIVRQVHRSVTRERALARDVDLNMMREHRPAKYRTVMRG